MTAVVFLARPPRHDVGEAEHDLLVGFQHARLVRDLPQPVAGAHQVEDDGHVAALFGGHAAHAAEGLFVLFLGAVRKVQTDRVDARVDERTNGVVRR